MLLIHVEPNSFPQPQCLVLQLWEMSNWEQSILVNKTTVLIKCKFASGWTFRSLLQGFPTAYKNCGYNCFFELFIYLIYLFIYLKKIPWYICLPNSIYSDIELMWQKTYSNLCVVWENLLSKYVHVVFLFANLWSVFAPHQQAVTCSGFDEPFCHHFSALRGIISAYPISLAH